MLNEKKDDLKIATPSHIISHEKHHDDFWERVWRKINSTRSRMFLIRKASPPLSDTNNFSFLTLRYFSSYISLFFLPSLSCWFVGFHFLLLIRRVWLRIIKIDIIFPWNIPKMESASRLAPRVLIQFLPIRQKLYKIFHLDRYFFCIDRFFWTYNNKVPYITPAHEVGAHLRQILIATMYKNQQRVLLRVSPLTRF